jgi:DNA polymerase-3 subunit gamma/tau
VRDAQSLLDQAIVQADAGAASPRAVRDMLGLADRIQTIELFERVVRGEAGLGDRGFPHALSASAPTRRRCRARPALSIVTRRQAVAKTIGPDDPLRSCRTEQAAAAGGPGAAVSGKLTRVWQMLLKAYAADLPAPEEALRKLSQSTDGPRHAPPLPPAGGGPRASMRLAVAEPAPAEPAPPLSPPAASPRLASFEDAVALARAKRDIQLVESLEREVRLARFEQGSIAFTPVEGAPSGLAQTLARRLQEWTGERWMVALVTGSTAPTLREAAEARDAERASGAAAHPLVRKVLDRFKGARIVDVRRPEPAPTPTGSQADDEVGYADSGVNAADDG